MLVWKFSLRILVEPPHEAMGGGVGEVEVVILEIFTMVAFRITQAEWPLLEDRIHTIPHRQGEAEPALFVADPQ